MCIFFLKCKMDGYCLYESILLILGLSKPDVTILPSKEHYTLNRIKLYMMAREMPAVQLTTVRSRYSLFQE